jgi:D-hydroxyproline dehydrogenase subunit alpha
MADAFPVVVVGAGPAGLAAACRVAECGARVALIDDNPQAGGQIWRGAASAAAPWIRKLEQFRVEWIAGARVFAAPSPGVLSLESYQGNREIHYRNLILATGARELFLPFPGWTLPNVVGAGGLQALAKSGLPVSGKRVVVAGSGPLLLAVAKYLREHGARVALIAEQAAHPSVVRFAFGLAGSPGKLAQAMRLRAGLVGLRYLTSCWPLSAEGDGKLERVTLRRGGKTWSEPCDYLACGFGLIPNLELASLLGCKLNRRGVAVDDFQQTSVPGVYSAGEATGIGGLDLAIAEGEIAGFAAAEHLQLARSRFAERASAQRFAESLERAFALRAELKDLASADTILCRCEDVPLGRVRECASFREAKLHTRCGMGPCQGRVCGGAAGFLFNWRTESPRPPIFPARISSLR